MIGKSPYRRPADRQLVRNVGDWKAGGGEEADPIQGHGHRVEEALPKAKSPLLVPAGRIFQLSARFWFKE